jgi:hypothetical protein
MSYDWQDIAALICVGLACCWLGHRVWLLARKPPGRCGGCGACGKGQDQASLPIVKLGSGE